MAMTQAQPSEAALDSLSSRLRIGPSKDGNGLPPLGTRTVGSGTLPPPAEQPAPPTSKSAQTPQPPLQPLPPPKQLSSEEVSKISFEAPKKRIVSDQHLEKWKQSTAFDEVLGFIMYCNDSIVGKKLNEVTIQGQDSAAVQSITSILDRVSNLVKETPAEKESTSRFGNPAFREFYSKVKRESQSFHESIPNLKKEAIAEVERYFVECFGNEKRIDYGSGMELNFACWL